jgi:hypothetical protein
MNSNNELTDTCVCCKVTPCIDLLRHKKKDDELIGGELYVYKFLKHEGILSEDLQKFVCANGVLLQCACFIIGTAYSKNKNHFLTIICNEIVPDMKASFYLAMSGHYRQAILILRIIFENFLYGLYFHSEDYVFSKTSSAQKDVLNHFNSWISGSFRKSDDYLLDIIEKASFINKEERKAWANLFSRLSEFVHTLLHTSTGEKIKYGKVEIEGCYSEVKFDREKLAEWSKYYQNLLFLILFRIITIYPRTKQTSAVKLALKYIKSNFKDEKKEIANIYLENLIKMRVGKIAK